MSVILFTLRNFYKHLFHKTSPVAASTGQRLVLVFVTNHTGRLVFFGRRLFYQNPNLL